jgi:hypothetical protein
MEGEPRKTKCVCTHQALHQSTTHLVNLHPILVDDDQKEIPWPIVIQMARRLFGRSGMCCIRRARCRTR